MSHRRPTVACLLFHLLISPLCGVAQMPDCGVYLFSYFKYKPFMWCRSDVRLWHAPPLFSVISPLCGVAPTPDCGIIVPHFPLEESFRHSLSTQYFTLNYWVSLGRFYLLDIHFDYSYISPLWGVAQTPDCGMLVISFTYKPFTWCRTDARLWHACYFIYL